MSLVKLMVAGYEPSSISPRAITALPSASVVPFKVWLLIVSSTSMPSRPSSPSFTVTIRLLSSSISTVVSATFLSTSMITSASTDS